MYLPSYTVIYSTTRTSLLSCVDSFLSPKLTALARAMSAHGLSRFIKHGFGCSNASQRMFEQCWKVILNFVVFAQQKCQTRDHYSPHHMRHNQLTHAAIPHLGSYQRDRMTNTSTCSLSECVLYYNTTLLRSCL